jgi:hypothetical protein
MNKDKYYYDLDKLKYGDIFKFEWKDKGYVMVIKLIALTSDGIYSWRALTLKQNIDPQWNGYNTFNMNVWLSDDGYPTITKIDCNNKEKLMAILL